MLDHIAKALPKIPSLDQLPTVEEAVAILSRAKAVERTATPPAKVDIGIPDRFAAADLEAWSATTLAQQRVASVVGRFASNFAVAKELGSNLVFRGGVGTGKTTLACATLRAVHAAGYSARYTTLAQFFRRMKESFSGEGPAASAIQAQFARVDLLVLDEVGVQYGSKAELVMLTELVDERYAAKRPTIVVSNLGGAALIDMVGERAADRLAELGVDLLFDWPSFRRRQRVEAAP
jgi:DNA replication protein DnaC